MMSNEYLFRGKVISGAEAYIILNNIRRVLQLAPNPTQEDIDALEKIVADFEVQLVADMEAYEASGESAEDMKDWG